MFIERQNEAFCCSQDAINVLVSTEKSLVFKYLNLNLCTGIATPSM